MSYYRILGVKFRSSFVGSVYCYAFFYCYFLIFVSVEFATFLRYRRHLEFTTDPDYPYITKLFQDIMDQNQWKCNWDFDWHKFNLPDVCYTDFFSSLNPCFLGISWIKVR